MLRAALAQRRRFPPLPPAAAAGLHGSGATQALAAEVAPARMEEAAQVVREVMGEPDPPPIRAQQALEEPLPLAALRFDDPQAAFKVRACCYVAGGPFLQGQHASLPRGTRSQHVRATCLFSTAQLLGPTLSLSAAPAPPPQAKSTLDLLRTLFVFRVCRIQSLVQNADSLLALSKRVFGSTLTNTVVRATFYKQFVAGESLEAVCDTIAALRRHGIGGITYFAESEPGGTWPDSFLRWPAPPPCLPCAPWSDLQGRTRCASSPRCAR
jgi:proline dehydrogenase